MSIQAPALVERRAILRYLRTRWKRSAIPDFDQGLTVPDPGHGKDEICPIVYFGLAFDPSKPSDLRDLSAYSANELKGYGTFQLTVLDGTWAGQELSLSIISNEWTLDAPGGPVIVFPQSDVVDGATVVFALENEDTFTAVVAAGHLYGVGFIVVTLAEGKGEKKGTSSRSPVQTPVRMIIAIAAPRNNGPNISAVYGGALAMIFRGFRFLPDASAAEGTLEKDLADSGIQHIYQSAEDPVQEMPNRIGERDNWHWYHTTITYRRLYRLPVAGVQTIDA